MNKSKVYILIDKYMQDIYGVFFTLEDIYDYIKTDWNPQNEYDLDSFVSSVDYELFMNDWQELRDAAEFNDKFWIDLEDKFNMVVMEKSFGKDIYLYHSKVYEVYNEEGISCGYFNSFEQALKYIKDCTIDLWLDAADDCYQDSDYRGYCYTEAQKLMIAAPEEIIDMYTKGKFDFEISIRKIESDK